MRSVSQGADDFPRVTQKPSLQGSGGGDGGEGWGTLTGEGDKDETDTGG